MKKKYILIGAISLLIVSFIVLSITISKGTVQSKTYSGTSMHWKVTSHMIKDGTTAISILPRKEFDYPETLRIDVQELDNSMHTVHVPIKPVNSYTIDYPTSNAFNRRVSVIAFNIYFVDGTYEIVELQLEN